ncbi:ATP-binding protein [Anabaena sp. AL09]|uniref:ATP-binding protein n=1 Tax=Anabaena sp. AL09 TaxID=1710891 RepID=UPI0026017C3D|nr:ATP-binding protein [Anabaena sp. AL09]
MHPYQTESSTFSLLLELGWLAYVRTEYRDSANNESHSVFPQLLKPSLKNEEEELPTSEFTIYRQAELNRTTASLLANGAILIVGEEGSGKSVLGNAVVEKLTCDGFLVAFVEPTTPKQMLLEITQQFELPTEDIEGKNLTVEKLKRAICLQQRFAIAQFLSENTAFIVLDDAQSCDMKFRIWLKQLRRKGVPMLVLATDPPRSDIFINIPRIELKPLPEKAIRQIMKAAAQERAIALTSADLSKLQERAGGNPMLAIRAIEEEYLGLDIEGADHRRYFDITPLILVVGVIFGGIAAAIFLGLSRLLYSLPQEERRIR